MYPHQMDRNWMKDIMHVWVNFVYGHYFQNDTFCGRIVCDRMFVLTGLVAMNVASVLSRSINCTKMHQNVNSLTEKPQHSSGVRCLCDVWKYTHELGKAVLLSPDSCYANITCTCCPVSCVTLLHVLWLVTGFQCVLWLLEVVEFYVGTFQLWKEILKWY
jgi:hypothetical protein